jgi:hypothetical protein
MPDWLTYTYNNTIAWSSAKTIGIDTITFTTDYRAKALLIANQSPTSGSMLSMRYGYYIDGVQLEPRIYCGVDGYWNTDTQIEGNVFGQKIQVPYMSVFTISPGLHTLACSVHFNSTLSGPSAQDRSYMLMIGSYYS